MRNLLLVLLVACRSPETQPAPTPRETVTASAAPVVSAAPSAPLASSVVAIDAGKIDKDREVSALQLRMLGDARARPERPLTADLDAAIDLANALSADRHERDDGSRTPGVGGRGGGGLDLRTFGSAARDH